MKRAKIMLIAIAVIATVGGALAFKAQKFADKNVYCATLDLVGNIYCTLTDYKTAKRPGEILATTTLPCRTSHEAVFGIGAATTTSYYTTTTCPTPFFKTVYTTDIQ